MIIRISHEIIENLTEYVIIIISVKREERIDASEKQTRKSKKCEKTA